MLFVTRTVRKREVRQWKLTELLDYGWCVLGLYRGNNQTALNGYASVKDQSVNARWRQGPIAGVKVLEEISVLGVVIINFLHCIYPHSAISSPSTCARQSHDEKILHLPEIVLYRRHGASGHEQAQRPRDWVKNC